MLKNAAIAVLDIREHQGWSPVGVDDALDVIAPPRGGGWPRRGVTVSDIATATRVASKAVLASTDSKSAILSRVVDKRIAASGYEQTMKQVLAPRTPETVVEALARGTRLGDKGQFAVHEAIRKALPSHEHSEVLCERAFRHCRDALRTVGRHLRTPAPPPCCTVEETAGPMWFRFGPSGWRTLVRGNGWSWDRAEAFLHRTAVATLYGHCVRRRCPQAGKGDQGRSRVRVTASCGIVAMKRRFRGTDAAREPGRRSDQRWRSCSSC
ncbi:hypothetical protein ACF1FX_19280 [Streptomyces sp. NPDC014646]|uniref:hypothetical protein n=1 Tax=unclassified Streptomyces TaxID=2593676 RepID=UPI0036F9E07A